MPCPVPPSKTWGTGGWEYIFEGNSKGLPSEIRVTDIYGDATYYTVEWQITPQENDGYYLRPVTQEEIAGDTIDSVSSPAGIMSSSGISPSTWSSGTAP